MMTEIRKSRMREFIESAVDTLSILRDGIRNGTLNLDLIGVALDRYDLAKQNVLENMPGWEKFVGVYDHNITNKMRRISRTW